MKRVSIISMCLLTACVTINIYFPAKAADKVADEIIKGIQQESRPLQEPATERPPEVSAFQLQVVMLRLLDNTLNILIPTAHAAADLSINTAEIRTLRAAMKKRYASLQPYYIKQFVGIKADGLVTVRNAGNIPLQDRNKVNKLVVAENSDRNKLYQAIANANGHPSWVGDIRATFAKRWISNAQSGWTFQKTDGSWHQK